MPDVHDVLNTLSDYVHDVLNTPRVHDVLTIDNYHLASDKAHCVNFAGFVMSPKSTRRLLICRSYTHILVTIRT